MSSQVSKGITSRTPSLAGVLERGHNDPKQDGEHDQGDGVKAVGDNLFHSTPVICNTFTTPHTTPQMKAASVPR